MVLTPPLLVLALGACVLVGVGVARRTGLPDPVVLLSVGLLASLLPGVPVLRLPPDVVFLVFLPPLLYRASFLTDPQVLRRNVTPLSLLAVGMVLATAGAVAGVAMLVVPGLTFAQGLVLGAVVSPTDPVAATQVFRRLGAPRTVVDLVEGESLINDASALVLFAVALRAATGHGPSLGSALGLLALSVLGGVLVGAAVFALVLLVGRRTEDTGLQLLLTVLTPYAAYLTADRIGASGVLAVVTTGVLLGAREGGQFGARLRLQGEAFWSFLDLLLNAVLFVLLGLQVRRLLLTSPGRGPGQVALACVAVVAAVVGVRLLWQFVVPPPVYRLRRLVGLPESRSTPGERLALGWTGMRGAISLAAVLALPPDFPSRSLLVFLVVTVVLVTLGVQGVTLPYLLRALHLTEDPDAAEQERRTRLALVQAALSRLDELEERGELPPGGAMPLRTVWEQARHKLQDDPDERGMDAPEVDLTELRLDLARVQFDELERQREQGLAPPGVVRELRAELDLQQVRLGRDD